jgi:membrane protein implicated in regulation of membrane protease activity
MALEAFAPGFILLPLGVASILTAPMAVFLNSWISVLALLSANIIIVFLVFSKFVKPRMQKKAYKTNADSLVGREVVVAEKILSDKDAGMIKLYGDDWRALNTKNEEIQIGERVRIVAVEGNKVRVERI